MPDLVLIDGDVVTFLPVFGAAIVAARPGRISGSGPARVANSPVCVDGDERRVQVPGCTYVAPPYVVPGVGTLKISALAGNQKTRSTRTKGSALLLRGAMFTAAFEVQSPAQQPTPVGPVPDPTPQYSGQGSFVSRNTTVRSA